MNKEDVKKALDNCIGVKPCSSCPYDNGFLNFPACAVELMKDALDVINQMENKDTMNKQV